MAPMIPLFAIAYIPVNMYVTSLCDSSLVTGNQLISDMAFKQFGRNCPDLAHLYMVDCPRITDLTLKSLVSCRCLTVVNLADCIK